MVSRAAMAVARQLHHLQRYYASLLLQLRFLRYLFQHKRYVFWACRALNVPLWQAIIHDWTKFRPSEYFPYLEGFQNWLHIRYGDQGGPPFTWSPGGKEQFLAAKNRHYKRNPHHWHYWVLLSDDRVPPEPLLLPIPERFVREMVADWVGAGFAQEAPDIRSWYNIHKNQMLLHPDSRLFAEQLLDEMHQRGHIP